jgi:hypothetical protein
MIAGWLGWALLAFLVAGAGYMWYEQRKKKNQERSHWYIPVEGFGVVWVPKQYKEEEARELADSLHAIQKVIWSMCNELYQPKKEVVWYMDTIGLGFVSHSMEHPHIVYNPGPHKLYIKVEPKATMWFAHEVHNVYRRWLWGIAHIYTPVSLQDQVRAVLVRDEITKVMEHDEGGNNATEL